jgi:hypothetical protein
MEPIKNILESRYPTRSASEALAAYSHIELSDEELSEAILEAKMKKERLHELERIKIAEDRNRRNLVQTRWSYDQTKSFILYRATCIFEKPFEVDEHNVFLVDLLCYYFSEDPRFLSTCEAAGIKNPSLEKGILLAGNMGTGKTWMMKLFQKNQRQVYYMRNAKVIASSVESGGAEAELEYVGTFPTASNDPSTMFQPFAGLCIDDMGTEEEKKYFGNHRNVIGDLIELRYARKTTGLLLHGTTNLTSQQLKEYYGDRVISRMREIFNFIELPGEDRRK